MVQQAYNGQMAIPLPDMEENAMPSVPNLLASGVDQMSGRITSVIPAVSFSSVKPGVRRYDRIAQSAGRAVTGWWQLDQVPMKMKQRGRHLIAYGMSPVIVRWDQRKNAPTWQVRHPLETYPSTDIMPGNVTPTDCLFAYRRSAGWLRSMGYGDSLVALMGRTDIPQDASILLMEYIDADSTQLIAAGYRTAEPWTMPMEMELTGSTMRGIQLEAYPNLADRCPVVVPMRVTLDTATGQFDNMIGMYYQQAKLMALEIIAVEKGIFPDTYLVSRPGEIGRFLDGPHDGRTGMVNIVAGGDIREVQSQPGYLTNPTIDRLERNQRVTAGIPAEFGGESSTNIRTGRRGDAVLSAVIDFPVAEAQETFAFSLQMENQVAIDLAKKWDGDVQRTIYVGTGNAMQPVTYVPNETFITAQHVVSYPAAGSDVNSLIVGIGQRVGLGIMSKQTAATLDPYIDNPEVEHDRIIAEGLEQALVASIQQQAASGQIPPLVLSKVMKLVKDDRMEIADALTKVTEEAAKQTQGPPVEQAAAQGAMQGLAGAPPEAIPGPSQSQTNLLSLLSTLRRPQTAMGGA
ncbi:MAG: hypothetical protein KGN78_05615 [Actinomycetales bacterium]|nr:hypothetical protein [Actinomycetales bacterium]